MNFLIGTFSIWAILATFVLTTSNGATTHIHKTSLLRPKLDEKHPVILVPGDGGSHIEMRLNESANPHFYCKLKGDWINAWVNYEYMAPYVINCWAEAMRLVYDVATRRTHPPHGVETRVPGWGDTKSIEWMDTQMHLPGAAYFTHIVDSLVKEQGYVRNESIRGAPYDFRRGPNEQTDFYRRLALLVEETFVKNQNTSVLLVCHSMGCPLTKFMLNTQTHAWRQKFVRAMVALAGAWGGSVKALKTFASGDSFGIPFASPRTLRGEERSYPSLAFLAPSRRLWNESEVLVETPWRNYTVADYESFFHDIGYLVGMEMIKDVEPWALDGKPPGVETFCLHGEGEPTAERLVYSKEVEFPDSDPELLMGDGDGTVNLRSLRYCAHFAALQEQPVHMRPLKTTHMGILGSPEVLKAIASIAKGTHTGTS